MDRREARLSFIESNMGRESPLGLFKPRGPEKARKQDSEEIQPRRKGVRESVQT